jgi:alginate O-acetyltransferase complex protein AlgI
MVFDSYAFLAFFALVLPVFHLLRRWLRLQNAFLLAASCVFYGWWDWRFLFLMFGTAAVDYFAALGMERASTPARRKHLLLLSLASNLTVLFVFKYFDFFVASALAAGDRLGVTLNVPLLHVVLPVGISFYTFQSISYAVDVYRREFRAERDPIAYFTFVCCFPHLVAGPIQRPSHLLTQLKHSRVVTRAHVREAVWLLAWGFFLKECVADALAPFVALAFREGQTSGWWTILGTLAFTVQIYCDFNAYSIIARGAGRLLGLEFIWNFKQPYFSLSLQDFWRRWHISLSTWLRDYLYIALGGNRLGPKRTYVNLLMTMVLGGLWHGAAWNFVAWGVLHGGALAIERFAGERFRGRSRPALVGWATTMAIVFVSWWLFRCQSGR